MSKENFNEKLNKGIDQIKHIGMTIDEKKHMLENILNSNTKNTRPIPSPFNFQFFVSVFQNKNLRVMHYVIATSLIFVLGGGVSLASMNSLPGNTLYGIKINVVEPVNSFFKFSPEAKAKYESSLATERLIEAEALAGSGKLDESKEETLSKLIEQHTNNLNNFRGQLPKDEKFEKVDNDIVTGFEDGVNKHMQNLDRIRNNENKIDKEETKINKTARASVAKVKENNSNNKKP